MFYAQSTSEAISERRETDRDRETEKPAGREEQEREAASVGEVRYFLEC